MLKFKGLSLKIGVQPKKETCGILFWKYVYRICLSASTIVIEYSSILGELIPYRSKFQNVLANVPYLAWKEYGVLHRHIWLTEKSPLSAVWFCCILVGYCNIFPGYYSPNSWWMMTMLRDCSFFLSFIVFVVAGSGCVLRANYGGGGCHCFGWRCWRRKWPLGGDEDMFGIVALVIFAKMH